MKTAVSSAGENDKKYWIIMSRNFRSENSDSERSGYLPESQRSGASKGGPIPSTSRGGGRGRGGTAKRGKPLREVNQQRGRQEVRHLGSTFSVLDILYTR